MKSGLGGTLHARIAGSKPHAGRPRTLLGLDGPAVSDHAVGKGRAAADHERSEQLGAELVHDQVDGGIGKPAARPASREISMKPPAKTERAINAATAAITPMRRG